MYNDNQEVEHGHEPSKAEAVPDWDDPESVVERHSSEDSPESNVTPAGEEPIGEDLKTPRNGLRAFAQKVRERIDGRKQKPSASATLVPKSRIAQDRTKVTIAIAGAAVFAIILFLVTFTRPTAPHRQKDQRAHPNLGRPHTAENDNRSVIPLRTADGVKADEKDGKITAQDVLNTTKLNPRTPVKPPAPAQQKQEDYALNRIPFPATGGEQEAPRTAPAAPQPEKYQASLVFVRSATSVNSASAQLVSTNYKPVVLSAFFSALPPGTRLVARLESPVSTALKNTPAVAAIEYNYSRDGEIVIPAGSKAFGKLENANEHGFVELAFDVIDLPDGTSQRIDGFGESLTYQPIKGSVTGRNIGLQLLVQSLTGIGSIAAATVGNRGGTGINDSLSNNVILRERLSENMAMAGQNQMSSLAYRQNIVVTVPGNTRFYLVLGRSDKAREGSSERSPITNPVPAQVPAAPSVQNASMETQYMQELDSLKRQLDQLSRQQQSSDSSGQLQAIPPPEP
jgi:hypothetical protein